MTINWTEVLGVISAPVEAAAIAAALSPIVGGSPGIISHGDYYEIALSPAQEDRLTDWVLSQLNKEPGPVRMDLSGVSLKVVTRKYWPWVLGLFGAGAVIGYAGGRR